MYIYQGIIQPRFDYAITIWGFTTKYNLTKVQRLQNRVARIITGDFDYVHVRGIDIVKNLKWMNFIQRRDYFVALSVFKCIHGMSPLYLSDCITMYNEIYSMDALYTCMYLYTGSLGLNLLDPVSCRGLFALFALSFDIVSPEASRHRRLTFRFAPGRHARIQQTFIVICGVDRWTDGRTTRVRAPPVCV